MKQSFTALLGLMLSQQLCGLAFASQASPQSDKISNNTGSAARSYGYVADLQSRFQRFIIYRSDKAAEIVKGFNVDCKQTDGRYVRLENILLVGISQLQSTSSHVVDFVQETSGEVRVTQALADNAGRLLTRPDVIFETNKWGELIPVGVPAGALSIACTGALGPIWSLPASETGNGKTQVGPEADAYSQKQTDPTETNEQSMSPAEKWTHGKQCEFFKLAAFSMINFRDQGRPQSYGAQMVAVQLASYHTIADRPVSLESGLEAETKLNLAGDIFRMAHDIWTVRNSRGEPIPTSLVLDYASNSCGWPAFDW